MHVPMRKSELERIQKQTEDYHFTPAMVRSMEEEVVRLEKTERPRAAEEVARTGAMGDFSENAAYQVAKAKLRGINTRITTLQERLKRAVVIAASATADTVQLGMTVTIKVQKEERIYTIVGSAEADPGKGKISHTSPLGAALLGHRVGETISYTTTKGTNTGRIIALTIA